MTTNVDNIPMKTVSNGVKNDDSDDPVVKDILNEFQQELKLNTNSNNGNNYEINYEQSPQPSLPSPQQPPQPSPQPSYQKPVVKTPNLGKSYYNEEYLRKSAIIIIIISIIFSPIIYNTIVERIPTSFIDIFTSYDFYIKIIIGFILIYLSYIYNLI